MGTIELLPQGEAAEAALDRGFAALQVLTPYLQAKANRIWPYPLLRPTMVSKGRRNLTLTSTACCIKTAAFSERQCLVLRSVAVVCLELIYKLRLCKQGIVRAFWPGTSVEMLGIDTLCLGSGTVTRALMLQVLTSEYGEKVQRMRELRASRADRTAAGVAYSVGQVFR